MNNMNPSLIRYVAMGGIIGYLVKDTRGCLYGILSILIISMITDVVTGMKKG